MDESIGAQLARRKRPSGSGDLARSSPCVNALAGTGRGSGFKPRCEVCKRPVLSDPVEVQLSSPPPPPVAMIGRGGVNADWGGRAGQAMGKVYHQDHFRCKRCSATLMGTPYQFYRDRAYCADCHTAKLTDRCAQCNEPILQDKIEALGKSWYAHQTSHLHHQHKFT